MKIRLKDDEKHASPSNNARVHLEVEDNRIAVSQNGEVVLEVIGSPVEENAGVQVPNDRRLWNRVEDRRPPDAALQGELGNALRGITGLESVVLKLSPDMALVSMSKEDLKVLTEEDKKRMFEIISETTGRNRISVVGR